MYLDNFKKKEISEEVIVNTWLQQYFNITLKEVEKDFKKDEDGNFLPGETKRFYQKYAITQEQHDEWDSQIRKELKKKLRLSKSMFDRQYPFIYLNTAPSIK